MYKIPARTLFVGKNLIYVPECHSTNTLLAELSGRQNLAEGTVVIAGHQSAGRGQRGTQWQVAPGQNITASFLILPHFLDAHRQFLLTQWVAVALAETVEKLGATQVQIKWPNDVLIGKQKVCGVLIENTLSGKKIGQSIVGIGLNVNQQKFDFAGATSLRNATGQPHELPYVFEVLCERLEQFYLEIRAGKRLRETYLHRLYGWRERVPLTDAAGDFDGVIEDVNEEGKLQVRKGDTVCAYGLKEIRFRGLYAPHQPLM